MSILYIGRGLTFLLRETKNRNEMHQFIKKIKNMTRGPYLSSIQRGTHSQPAQKDPNEAYLVLRLAVGVTGLSVVEYDGTKHSLNHYCSQGTFTLGLCELLEK